MSRVQPAAWPKRQGWTQPLISHSRIILSSDASPMLGLRLLGSQKHKRSGWSPWATSATSNSLPQPHLDGSRFPPLSSFGVVMKRTSIYSITISSSSAAHSWNGARATCRPSPQANGRPSWETCTKTQWPKQDDSPTTFDPNVFWKHGGPLFFGDIWSADVAAGRHDPMRLLPCHCVVQMSTVDVPDVH